VACEVVWEGRGVYRRFFGSTSAAEIMRSVIEVESDDRFDNIRYVINDLQDCADIAVDLRAIEEVAAYDHAAALSNPRIRIAVVADRHEVRALVDGYLNAGLSTYPVRMFARLDEARLWLGEA